MATVDDDGQPTVLLDTNIWGGIVDANTTRDVRSHARAVGVAIVAAPAAAYELARTTDDAKRRAYCDAVTRPWWKRLMPEAFTESEELLAAIRLHLPQWCREDRTLEFHQRHLYSDWVRARGGFWDRLRRDNTAEAARIRHLGDARLRLARAQARDARKAGVDAQLTFDVVDIANQLDRFPPSRPGHRFKAVEAWRVREAAAMWLALSEPRHAYLDWLEAFVDVPGLLRSAEDWDRLWALQVSAEAMPRAWLRWACALLQQTRRTTNGTPDDNQLATYLVEVDHFVTGDRAFAEIVTRLRPHAPVPLAVAHTARDRSSATAAVLDAIDRAAGSATG